MNTIAIRPALRMAALSAALVLAGCFGLGTDAPTPDVVVTQSPLPQEQEAVIGEGGITVAMLLPLSAGGSASGLAQAFQNAATMAMDEAETDNIRIVVRDTGGDAELAKLSAEAAISSDGAQLILGPVFAPAVQGVGGPARAGGVPVIAFSTDAGVAGRGVYLLSFLPRQDATRIVEYAAERGITSYAAVVPDNGYGLVMEAAFREAVASRGGRTVAVERYAPGQIGQAVSALAGRGAFEALFVPNGGDDPAAAAAALSSAGIQARLLGSGQWDSQSVISSPALAGSWFPGPSGQGYDAFAERYRNRFGATPPRTASLVYDAALLANGLVGAKGAQAFRPASLRSSEGFIGVDGIFRLTSEGLSERGLAVYEVTGGGDTRVVSPAPTKFSRSF